jgi:hypothetical protein
MHCSDSLLISYSCYMFRRMYVIIREPFLCVLLSYIKVHMVVKYVSRVAQSV